jgi:hypothetical protein
MDPEALYQQLGRLVEAMPELSAKGPLSNDTQRWLGTAAALVEELGDLIDSATIRVAADAMGDPSVRQANAQRIAAVVHRALAKAELRAPVSSRGAFIPAARPFDAFAAVAKVFSEAKSTILVVDPYMDEKLLTDFLPSVPTNVLIRLLADQHSYKPSLKPAVGRWATQFGSVRPLEARLAAAGSLHDRLFIIDNNVVWTLTQSFNALATRAHASLVRVDEETGKLKIAAYDDIWRLATPI